MPINYYFNNPNKRDNPGDYFLMSKLYPPHESTSNHSNIGGFNCFEQKAGTSQIDDREFNIYVLINLKLYGR